MCNILIQNCTSLHSFPQLNSRMFTFICYQKSLHVWLPRFTFYTFSVIFISVSVSSSIILLLPVASDRMKWMLLGFEARVGSTFPASFCKVTTISRQNAIFLQTNAGSSTNCKVVKLKSEAPWQLFEKRMWHQNVTLGCKDFRVWFPPHQSFNVFGDFVWWIFVV